MRSRGLLGAIVVPAVGAARPPAVEATRAARLWGRSTSAQRPVARRRRTPAGRRRGRPRGRRCTRSQAGSAASRPSASARSRPAPRPWPVAAGSPMAMWTPRSCGRDGVVLGDDVARHPVALDVGDGPAVVGHQPRPGVGGGELPGHLVRPGGQAPGLLPPAGHVLLRHPGLDEGDGHARGLDRPGATRAAPGSGRAAAAQGASGGRRPTDGRGSTRPSGGLSGLPMTQ